MPNTHLHDAYTWVGSPGPRNPACGEPSCPAAGCAGFSAASKCHQLGGLKQGHPVQKKTQSWSHQVTKKKREAETHCDVEHHVAVAVLSKAKAAVT